LKIFSYHFNKKLFITSGTKRYKTNGAFLEYLHKKGADACLEILDDVIAEPGTQSLAFQVTDIMHEWAPFSQELGLDSTCKFSSHYLS
jgi:hypothetical protein